MVVTGKEMLALIDEITECKSRGYILNGKLMFQYVM
jgi:hypothetical protein